MLGSSHLSWVVSVVVNWQGAGLLTCVLSLSRCERWASVYAAFMAFAVRPVFGFGFVVRAHPLAVDVDEWGGFRGFSGHRRGRERGGGRCVGIHVVGSSSSTPLASSSAYRGF